MTTLNFSLTTAVASGHLEHGFDFVVLYHCSDHLSSCQLCVCHFCQLYSMKTNSTMFELGDQLEDDSNCSAKWMLNHSGCSCSEGSSLLYWRFVFLTCVDLPVPFSLPGTLDFAVVVLPACSRQDFVNETDSHIFPFAMTVRPWHWIEDFFNSISSTLPISKTAQLDSLLNTICL